MGNYSHIDGLYADTDYEMQYCSGSDCTAGTCSAGPNTLRTQAEPNAAAVITSTTDLASDDSTEITIAVSDIIERPDSRSTWETRAAPATFTDTAVESGVRYVYRVKAINAAGVGGWSNYVRIAAC